MPSDLIVSNATKRFGDDVLAVDDVSLTVDEGQFLTLLGPSGCGKTTTLRMIAGFEEPTEGQVTLGGRDVTFVEPHRRPTSMVFQSYALFPHKTVGENVGFGLKMRGVDAEERANRVAETLELVELPGTEDRAINELSGGQQQRIALARAIITEPELLLLDEPLGALDLKLRKQMQLELKRIQDDLGITFVYVTHDQEEALTMSDEIVILNEGQIEQRGTPTEIYETPETRFVADFIGDTNLLDGSYKQKGTGAVVRCNDLDVPVSAVSSAEDGQSLSVSIRPEKIRLQNGNAPSHVSFSAEVEEIIYQGNIAKIHVTVNGERIVIEQQVVNDVDIPTKGDTCTINWSRESANVLTR